MCTWPRAHGNLAKVLSEVVLVFEIRVVEEVNYTLLLLGERLCLYELRVAFNSMASEGAICLLQQLLVHI